MIADGLAMASPYTRPNANPTGTPQATPTIAGRFRLIPARRGQAMPDPLPIHLGVKWRPILTHESHPILTHP